MRVIEDDKTVYGPSLNQFPQELNVGHLSAGTLWTLYKMDLKMALEGRWMPSLSASGSFLAMPSIWLWLNHQHYLSFHLFCGPRVCLIASSTRQSCFLLQLKGDSVHRRTLSAKDKL